MEVRCWLIHHPRDGSEFWAKGEEMCSHIPTHHLLLYRPSNKPKSCVNPEYGEGNWGTSLLGNWAVISLWRSIADLGSCRIFTLSPSPLSLELISFKAPLGLSCFLAVASGGICRSCLLICVCGKCFVTPGAQQCLDSVFCPCSWVRWFISGAQMGPFQCSIPWEVSSVWAATSHISDLQNNYQPGYLWTHQ